MILAVERKISGAFSEKGASDYLRLLGIAQTCRFQRKSFLGFLLSKSRNIDEYKERARLHSYWATDTARGCTRLLNRCLLIFGDPRKSGPWLTAATHRFDIGFAWFNRCMGYRSLKVGTL